MTLTEDPITEYQRFLEAKSQIGGMSGFDPVWMPDFMFGFQQSLVEWTLRRGRSAIFAECGLGKTVMQLVWAENVARKCNRPVLLVAPLGVGSQTVREALRFGMEAQRSNDGSVHRLTVTNYERLHYFDATSFSGVVCDESSCIKNFAGKRRRVVSEFLRQIPYRLLCTATPAPNDYVELGTSSEVLGELGHMDMLARFFKNDDKTIHLLGNKYGDITQKHWRFKPHAELPFWQWVCSWARACRKPSDLGFEDDGFILPELVIHEHHVKVSQPREGFLFDVNAVTLEEQRDEERRSVPERCEKVAELLSHDRPAIAWCHLNAEGDLLEKLIPDAKQVSGSQSDEEKEETLLAFVSGQVRKLITKPKIGGFGLNFQHCAHQTYFPSHSFEQWHQCIRRSLRFGQQSTVVNDVVATDGSAGIMANLRRKSARADEMFGRLVSLMNRFQRIERTGYGHLQEELPTWL